MAGLTINNPVTLSEAIISGNVIPGDTILLLPGEYVTSTRGVISGSDAAGKGVFRVQLAGTAALPITIKAQTPGTVTIRGGLELINSPHIILQDLIISPQMDDPYNLDYPTAVYCSSVGCKLIHNTITGGMEGIAWFGVGESEIYGNVIGGSGWHDGSKWRGTSIYTHNHNGGKVTIQHNIFTGSLGEFCVNLWSAGSNNVLDYDVLENAFLGNGLLLASHAGTVSRCLIKDNHLMAEIRLGEADNPNELDKTVDGNRVSSTYHAMALYYQTQAIIQNNILSKSQANDGTVDSYYSSGNIWNSNQYHNLNGNPFYLSGNPNATWEEWQTVTGETGQYSTSPPADAEFVYPDLYTPGKSLVCAWINNALTAQRTA